jgi:hypothetical protein
VINLSLQRWHTRVRRLVELQHWSFLWPFYHDQDFGFRFERVSVFEKGLAVNDFIGINLFASGSYSNQTGSATSVVVNFSLSFEAMVCKR